MAGAAVDRELTRHRAVRFAVAGQGDDPAIRRLLRDNPMQGSVSLSLEREPDYFAGTGVAGAEDETVVAFSSGNLVCMGRCTRRECWVDGVPARVTYLAELRLDAAARGQFAILRDGYRFFHERQADHPPEILFTSIASDNVRARRLLERGARGMPAYTFLGDLTTLLIAVPRRTGAGGLRVLAATRADVPDMTHLLNDAGRSHQLAAFWTEDRLVAMACHDLPLERFFLARGAGGELLACGGLWDQRMFRQTLIRGYSGMLDVARPAINLAARLFGTPRLPAPGTALAHAFLSPLAIAHGHEDILPDFVASLFPTARRLGIEYLTLALPATDPRLSVLRRRFSIRRYSSRLYRVGWPGDVPLAMRTDAATFLPDVSLL